MTVYKDGRSRNDVTHWLVNNPSEAQRFLASWSVASYENSIFGCVGGAICNQLWLLTDNRMQVFGTSAPNWMLCPSLYKFLTWSLWAEPATGRGSSH